ncbi:ABC transporter substrate-binding protein [Paenibacillus sp. GYB003]|uniref:ABC transporter substrate-binding protein n=1 Tax=Paenibacillus sp. GYB003 TaxID=2994392 RepID=UPI002F966BC5
MMKKRAAIWNVALLSTALAGCSGGAGTQPSSDISPENAKQTEPVKLRFYMSLSQTDEWIQQFIIAPAQKKFPHITFEIVRRGNGTNPAELLAAGQFPDFFYTSTPWLGEFIDLGLAYDMNEMMKKHGFDTGKLKPSVMDAIKIWGEKGEVFGLPFWMNYSVLYYNKDIFDKFGVSYPKDGMTWDGAIELSRSLSRTEGGIAYRGLALSGSTDHASQLSLPYVDAKTNSALLNTDGFKKVYQLVLDVSKVPGNNTTAGGWGRDWFLKDKNLAMWPFYGDVPAWIADMEAKGETINWDMATMPYFAGTPEHAFQVDSHNLHISSVSKHKDAAFQVVSYLLTKEPQLELVKNGVLSALVDPEIDKSFGANLSVLKGKNVQAILKAKPAPKYKMTIYDQLAMNEFNKALADVQKGTKDINTALRDANESANKEIQTMLQGKKK